MENREHHHHEEHHHHHHHHHHRAVGFITSFTFNNITIKGKNMSAQLQIGTPLLVTVTPVDVNGNATSVADGSVVFSSSDETVFTVAPVAGNQLQAILTPVADGAASLNVTGNADATGATQVPISSSDAISVTTAPPPPPPPAGQATGFTFAYSPVPAQS